MTAFIVRRLLQVLVLLWAVATLTFIFFSLLPATDPAVQRAGRQATPELIEQVRRDLGLDRPKIEQYFSFLGDVAQFDFGRSYVGQRQDVLDLIFERLPATIWLTLGAVAVWLTLGLSIGIISAIYRRSIFDRLSMSLALVAISAPVYWLGLLSLYLFAPEGGVLGIGFLGGSGSYPEQGIREPGTWLKSLLLPWFVLAASFAAVYARLLRGSLIDVMGEDYVRTARAKGLPERTVIRRHAVRSAITPIVTILALDVGVLLGGAILTETVFNIPGIGRLARDAIVSGNLPVIQGTVLFGAFFIIVANLIVDIVYAFLDPRVRLT
jgi:peptide/nickel transport system permease protein